MRSFFHIQALLLLLVSALAQQRNDDVDIMRAVLLEASFDSHEQGFRFRNNRATSFYSSGSRRLDGGVDDTGALQIELGGRDKFTVDNMEGFHAITLTLQSPAIGVRLEFDYNAIMGSGFRSDEVTTLLGGFPGELQTVERLRGANVNTGGWKRASLLLGQLSAGSHLIKIGAKTSKKTRKEALMRMLIDSVRITRRRTIRPSSDQVMLLDTNFGDGLQGNWDYRSDVFRGVSNSVDRSSFQTHGGHDGMGAMKIELITSFPNSPVSSGAWRSRPIQMPAAGELAITITYQFKSPDLKAGDVAQFLCAVNGQLISSKENQDYVSTIAELEDPRFYYRTTLRTKIVGSGPKVVDVGAYAKSQQSAKTTLMISAVQIKLFKA